MTKTIKIQDQDWKYLKELQLQYGYKRLDEIVNLFFIHCKDSIKKGNLELFYQNNEKGGAE